MGGGARPRRSRVRPRSTNSDSHDTTSGSGKKRPLPPPPPSAPPQWRSVSVGLPDDDAVVGATKRKKSSKSSSSHSQSIDQQNHYDNYQLARQAAKDLEGMPEEGVGIFLGLQVLDGSAYQVLVNPTDGSKRIVYNTVTAATAKDDASEEEEEEEDMEDQASMEDGEDQQDDEVDDEAEELGDDSSESENDNDENDVKDEKPSKRPRHEATAKKDEDENDEEDSEDEENEQDSEEDLNDEDADKTTTTTCTSSDYHHQQQDQQQDVDEDPATALALQNIQQEWMMATGGVVFHSNHILSTLVQYQWHQPTPIQATTLAAACLGRRNVVGAAATGSGKTLAYLLPILQDLYDKYQTAPTTTTTTGAAAIHHHHHDKLQALILTPTRELALQVGQECNKFPVPTITTTTTTTTKGDDSKSKSATTTTTKLHKTWCSTLVGGLAIAKQARILSSPHPPPILVATPGRLWELISSRDYPYLNDLSQVRFLVIDEADRMIQQGSFPQLVRILDEIHKANPMDDDDNSEEEDSDDGENEQGPKRLSSLPGIPGEAKVHMLNDELLQQLQQQQRDDDDDDDGDENDDDDEPDDDEQEEADDEPAAPHAPMELDDEEYERMRLEQEALEQQDEEEEDDISLPLPPPVRRQTFIYSATLTLPPTTPTAKASAAANKKKKKGSKAKGARATTVEGAIAELLEKARAKGPTKIVDLTTTTHKNARSNPPSQTKSAANDTSKTTSSNNASSSSRLPPGLTLEQITCTQMHKDSHLYAYLVTTEQGASGPALVFCNSILAVRRVGATLQTLGLNVRILHAHMPQKSRFKAVESLRQPKCRTIVVATDVAARGLDIPAVATVIHYDVPRAVDTFVHRAGRTARGMGEKAIGASLSLVSPAEDKVHSGIAQSLNATFTQVRLDGRLLSNAQERTNLASKIVSTEQVETKAKKSNQWFLEKAEEAGLELDDGLLEEGLAGGNQREQHQLREANKAKSLLRQLLSQPMRTQRFGKFLSRNSAAKVAPPQGASTVVVPDERNPKRKNKKRKLHRN